MILQHASLFTLNLYCSCLGLFWIFSNLYRVKSIHARLKSVYMHSVNKLISGVEDSTMIFNLTMPINFSLVIAIDYNW